MLQITLNGCYAICCEIQGLQNTHCSGRDKTMIAHIRVDPETLFQEQALLFKALSDPTRLEILSILIDANGTLDMTGLVDRLDSLKQPTISNHIRLLIVIGLIDGINHGMPIFH